MRIQSPLVHWYTDTLTGVPSAGSAPASDPVSAYNARTPAALKYITRSHCIVFSLILLFLRVECTRTRHT